MNISNVTITGNDHTVQCNHQGGLVGENIINIVIQGVTWDKCNEILFSNFTSIYVLDSVFQHSGNYFVTLMLASHDWTASYLLA